MCGKYVEERPAPQAEMRVTPFGRELQADAAAEEGQSVYAPITDLMAALKASLGKVEGDVTGEYDDLTIVALRDVTDEPVQISNRFPSEIGTVPETTLLLQEPNTRKDVLAFAIQVVAVGPAPRVIEVDTGLTLPQAELLYGKIGTWIDSQRGAPVDV